MALDRLDAGRAKSAAVVGEAKRSGRTGGRSEWGRWFSVRKGRLRPDRSAKRGTDVAAVWRSQTRIRLGGWSGAARRVYGWALELAGRLEL